MDPKLETKASKCLSFYLRHKQDLANEYGYVPVNTIISLLVADGYHVTFEQLVHIVNNDEKKRYSFDWSNQHLKANQGHSYPIKWEPTAEKAPEYLYHGTHYKDLPAIMNEGLKPMSRQHVHLSTDLKIAMDVGMRHTGRVREDVVILIVRAEKMQDDGVPLYLSDNDIWLADSVDPKYLILDFGIQ